MKYFQFLYQVQSLLLSRCKDDFFLLANVERSSLYLKLFKLVFGSVSLLANENEQMLKVNTHIYTILKVKVILHSNECRVQH